MPHHQKHCQGFLLPGIHHNAKMINIVLNNYCAFNRNFSIDGINQIGLNKSRQSLISAFVVRIFDKTIFFALFFQDL